MGRRIFWSLAVLTFFTTAPAAASDNGLQLFAKTWEGRTIVVKHTLYTLVYNERGKLGNTRRNKRAWLVVVTPFSGTYLKFDGRQS
jgi:hypothetical protein